MHRLRWAVLIAASSVIAHCAAAHAEPAPVVRGVGCVGLTVSDLGRSVGFYLDVLSFTKTLEVEQAGDALEQLQGVFGLRTRTVRVRLGGECLDLLQRIDEERNRSGRLVVRAQEEERRRLARDLHDEVNQSLTGILLRLEALSQSAPPELNEEIADVKKLVNQAMG